MLSTVPEARKNERSILAIGRRTISDAALCLADLASTLPGDFSQLVEVIANRRTPVIIAGVGKSRIIAEKISATLASTGVASFPMCALEALHGDLGRLQAGNILIALSSSGETKELLSVVHHSQTAGLFIASITRHASSTLAKSSDIAITIGDHPDSEPHGVLPNTSTTAMLAIGDAIAMALMWHLNTPLEELARLHPAGSIGRQLCAKSTNTL
jgi:arabinose-5-phosphate isomerase